MQVKLTQPTSCLEAMFIFSLIWSLGASCDSSSRAKLDKFLRALLSRGVTADVDRQDYDLGPGVAIKYPTDLLAIPLPQVLVANKSPKMQVEDCFCSMWGRPGIDVHIQLQYQYQRGSILQSPKNIWVSCCRKARCMTTRLTSLPVNGRPGQV